MFHAHSASCMLFLTRLCCNPSARPSFFLRPSTSPCRALLFVTRIGSFLSHSTSPSAITSAVLICLSSTSSLFATSSVSGSVTGADSSIPAVSLVPVSTKSVPSWVPKLCFTALSSFAFDHPAPAITGGNVSPYLWTRVTVATTPTMVCTILFPFSPPLGGGMGSVRRIRMPLAQPGSSFQLRGRWL